VKPGIARALWPLIAVYIIGVLLLALAVRAKWL
jgi:hypothetical protein